MHKRLNFSARKLSGRPGGQPSQREKSELSLRDLEDIERRTFSAYRELKEAHHFQYIIPNHDGEDSENWDAFYYPLGDARLALLAFVSLLTGKAPAPVEYWEEGLSLRRFGNSRESGIRGCCYVRSSECY
jgi:hypothetical protein